METKKETLKQVICFLFITSVITTDKGYVNYLVSETGVFLGFVYILVAIVFWKIQVKKINYEAANSE